MIRFIRFDMNLQDKFGDNFARRKRCIIRMEEIRTVLQRRRNDRGKRRRGNGRAGWRVSTAH